MDDVETALTTEERLTKLEQRLRLLYQMHTCAEAYRKVSEEETAKICQEFVQTGKEIMQETASKASR